MNNPFIIFLIEDNPVDVHLTQEVLVYGKVQHELHFVSDGVEAIEFLRYKGLFCQAPRVQI